VFIYHLTHEPDFLLGKHHQLQGATYHGAPRQFSGRNAEDLRTSGM